MGEIATALKNAAERIAEALGEAASKAEHRLMHDTHDNLKANVQAHVEHDEQAAEDLRRAAGGERSTPTIHGGGAGETQAAGAAGPGTSEAPTLHGGHDLPGGQPLTDPGQQLRSTDFPFLHHSTQAREDQAVSTEPRPARLQVAQAPAGHPPLDADALGTFQGRVEPGMMEPGVTYYRVVGHGSYPNGSFWTRTLPSGDDDIRGGLAIKNTWNGDHGVVAFTPNRPIPMWHGAAGPQVATGGVGHLTGGDEQLWIPAGNSAHGIGAGDGQWSIAPLPGKSES